MTRARASTMPAAPSSSTLTSSSSSAGTTTSGATAIAASTCSSTWRRRASDHLTQVELKVSSEDEGKRLDQLLAARVPELSRRKARVLLDLGGVFVDGVRTKQAGRLVREGQVVVAHLGGALERATKKVGRAARAEDERALPPYTIVHEDEDLVVVDKPAGLLTAPTPESDRNNLASLLGRRDEKR